VRRCAWRAGSVGLGGRRSDAGDGVSMQPLGVLVLPDEYWMKATSSSLARQRAD
jgi:hypothetical protein